MKNEYVFIFRDKNGKRVRKTIYAWSVDEAWKNADDYAYDHNYCDYQYVQTKKEQTE